MEEHIDTPRGNVTLRPALETEAQAYRSLRLEALRNHPEAFSADYALNERRPMDYWIERLRSLGSAGMMYFAIYKGEFIGMSGIYRGDSPKTQHSALIVGVYVRPEWRRLQIAERLVARCVAWGRTQGIKMIKLAVVTTNTAAIRCYARCGFRVYGIEPQALCYDGALYDELLMARHMDSTENHAL